jgi:hypothetical protein
MVLLALPPADHLLNEEIAANSCLLGDAARWPTSAQNAAEDPRRIQPRAAYPRRCSSVSEARIRLDSRKSVLHEMTARLIERRHMDASEFKRLMEAPD